MVCKVYLSVKGYFVLRICLGYGSLTIRNVTYFSARFGLLDVVEICILLYDSSVSVYV
jgi:hypothetical protein